MPRSPRFAVRSNGHYKVAMYVLRLLFLPMVWIASGAVVAAVYDYFETLGTTGKVLSAIAAVVLWPILLFGFDIRITR